METGRTATGEPAPAGMQVVTHELDAARSIGGRIWYPHQLTPLGGTAHFTMQYHSMLLPSLTVGTLHYSTGIRIDVTADYQTDYQVNAALVGDLRIGVGRADRVRVTNGRAQVNGLHVPIAITGWDKPNVMLGIKMGRGQVERMLERYLGARMPRATTLPISLDVASGPGRHWLAFVRGVMRLPTETHRVDDGLARYYAERTIGGFVALMARELDAEGSRSESPIPTDLVDRAREAIASAQGAPLSLDALAQMSGVTGRALQLAFRRRLGATPLEYQRGERLRRVNRELASSEPEAVKVRDVAIANGFVHLGRFAQLYRDAYGELPSETLAR